MGGKKKKKQTQTYNPAGYVEGASQQAIEIGQRIGGQQYTPYSGERVAPLSANEQMGIDLAASSAGSAQPYYDEAAGLARRGTQQFADADIQSYMNPYIKGALDPAAREIREEGARGAMALDSRASSMDAFGGSRAALMRSENREKTLQGISDLYGKGYMAAFESGAARWGEERTRDLMASGRIQELGTAVSTANRQDISTLMATGATDRNLQQALRDFDYQQFIENRDWDFRNLGGLLTAIEGTRGSTSSTTTTTDETSGGELAQILGLGIAALGVFYDPTGTATKTGLQMATGEEEGATTTGAPI